MHTLTSKPITEELFEFDNDWDLDYNMTKQSTIAGCERLRNKYLQTKNKRYWRALVQLLPDSWLQTRTVTMSYANLRNMYFQRRSHKLIEWKSFCDWIQSLPYAKELITLEEKENEIN